MTIGDRSKNRIKSIYSYLYDILRKVASIVHRNIIYNYIRYSLDNIRYTIINRGTLTWSNKIHVLSFKDTVDKLIKTNCSIIRYGDGEFNLIDGKSIGFQNENTNLSSQLKEILKINSNNLMIAIPNVFGSLTWLDIRSARFWQHHREINKKIYFANLSENQVYGNAHVFRPYIVSSKKVRENVGEIYSLTKSLWNNKDVVIIEGSTTKMGVGNDLLHGCKTVERIICPSVNAYSKIEDILSVAKHIDKNKLILISLGPTAKVLGYELYKLGYQVIDTGHIDSDYEWFCKKVNWKTHLNNGKHNAEGDDSQINIESISKNEIDKYESEIIAKIT